MDLISFPSHLSYIFSEELITCIYNECNNLRNSLKKLYEYISGTEVILIDHN